MHGLGNDYIIIDNLEDGYRRVDFSAFAKTFCRRKYSVGADGTLILCRSERAAFAMRIFNADGGEAEMCGNGIRCAARYYFEKVNSTSAVFDIETASGIRQARCMEDGIAVNMGFSESVREELFIGDRRIVFYRVSMGNPHCVIFGQELSDAVVLGLGPAIENHERFPEKTNVEFAEVLSRGKVRLRVWERGVGETNACGTGAAAVFAAASGLDKVDRPVRLILRGGVLDFDYSGRDIMMKGGAEYVHHGRLTYDGR